MGNPFQLARMRELGSNSDTFSLFTTGPSLFASHVDPTTEISRIRHSLFLLESHLLSRTASNTPTQEAASTNVQAVPIPQLPPTPIDPAVKDNIPGTYGRHGHRGYYAGPTSAASHLLMVRENLSFLLPDVGLNRVL
jgi:hypothetical protein